MDTKKAPVVQETVTIPKDIGKKHMAQEQKSELRKQVEQAIDAKLDEKVTPRFTKIDSKLAGMDASLAEIKNTLKLLVPKQP